MKSFDCKGWGEGTVVHIGTNVDYGPFVIEAVRNKSAKSMLDDEKGRPAAELELWGGVECTVARIGNRFRDQIAETGHDLRKSDIDLISGLGFHRVRYPISWEKIAPDRPDRLDFSWTDERLLMLRERGIDIIGGLLHHGSGPHYTSLIDPDFPKKFADFAAQVAERYPWIDMWTPINEPLTTARFSGLYGHWYPHKRGYPQFLRMLMNECLGTVEAISQIRKAVPDATIVQTEDLGKIFSTAPLKYQARHENERRWLSLDLLFGRVGRHHSWWKIFREAGIANLELERLEAGEAKPDLIGINHYLTSDRFLDHRLELYSAMAVGGNGRDIYVDAEAVRVKSLGLQTGIGPRLREAWERYGAPLAITEVHHGCTRDEQLRWFAEAWETAGQLRREGVDLRAVTLWSVFGNVDWRSLLTREDGIYDIGAYDVRSPGPRPTIIASAAKAYAKAQAFDHPVLDAPGWWKRSSRLYPWNGRCKVLETGGRKLLITGATGTLGNAFARICEHRGLPFCLTSRAELEICDPRSIDRAVRNCQPWAIINAAGYVRVADAEKDEERCFAWNRDGAENLARACAEAKIPFVTFSSDLVFDGRLGRPYVETDQPCPISVYGRSKAEAEEKVLAAHDKALVVRTSAFFSPWDQYNFCWNVVASLASGSRVSTQANCFVSPTYVPDLCHAVLDLLIDGESGNWHLANQGALSWYELACQVAEAGGFRRSLIEAVEGVFVNTTLVSERGNLLRPLGQALGEFIAQLGQDWEFDLKAAE